ncbi:TVP38/TMEM64 family protein [Azospirillum canadense]|uniref:TVP38/TMEM64 family protein n=1 Tax=Azospirillum canadense TaxID=403962 RepID=UPI002226994D|nr:TVP38/TMEM64 family protein [Azospirillum canadense]MCW2242081.1 putative membrane protein YdjX (TVP38/TMEM64 family) [Azospirillum canadense]
MAIGLLAVLVGGGVIVVLNGSSVALSPGDLVALLRSWGAWGVLLSVGLMILHSFVPFPAELLSVANGMVYGAVGGAVVTWGGAMLGAWAAFGSARILGRPWVHRVLAEHHWRVLDDWSGRQGWRALLIARLIPVIAFNLVNYAAGLTAVSWWTFTWATAVGIVPMTVLTAVMGDRMLDGNVWAWAALGVAILLLGAGAWWRRLSRTRTEA